MKHSEDVSYIRLASCPQGVRCLEPCCSTVLLIFTLSKGGQGTPAGGSPVCRARCSRSAPGERKAPYYDRRSRHRNRRDRAEECGRDVDLKRRLRAPCPRIVQGANNLEKQQRTSPLAVSALRASDSVWAAPHTQTTSRFLTTSPTSTPIAVHLPRSFLLRRPRRPHGRGNLQQSLQRYSERGPTLWLSGPAFRQ